MSTRIDGPLRGTLLHGETERGPGETSSISADNRFPMGPVVVMPCGPNAIEVLTETATYRLAAEGLRALLFLGNTVELAVDGPGAGPATAAPALDRRWIRFVLAGTHYLIHRSRLVWVARGDIPVDRLVCAEVT